MKIWIFEKVNKIDKPLIQEREDTNKNKRWKSRGYNRYHRNKKNHQELLQNAKYQQLGNSRRNGEISGHIQSI